MGRLLAEQVSDEVIPAAADNIGEHADAMRTIWINKHIKILVCVNERIRQI